MSAQPFVILILMRILQGKKNQAMSMIGAALGMLGVFLLVSQNHIITNENSALSIGLIFLCMISWAYASLFFGTADLPSNYFVNTGYQMLTGDIMLAIISFLLGETWLSSVQWSESVLWSMFLLIVFGSIVAFTSFNYLLKVVSPEKVATSTYVNPVIAILLGWHLLDEQITMQSIIAAIILFTGVYFINTKKKLAILSRFKNRRQKF